jgi:hypothetical protein
MGIEQFIGLYSVLCNRQKRGINSRRAFQFAHGWAVQNLTKEEWQELPEILQFGLASIRPKFAQTYKDLTAKELMKAVQIWRGRD